jgi:hypothetical protein
MGLVPVWRKHFMATEAHGKTRKNFKIKNICFAKLIDDPSLVSVTTGMVEESVFHSVYFRVLPWP